MTREFKAKLIERIKRTEDVESFRFSPEKELDFSPGQFSQIMFDESDPDNRELNKYLSFSSSPTKDYIEVTKRISQSQFSKHLVGLRLGDKVLFRGPMGNCIYKDEYKKIGFLIGGIGITPVISIIEYIVDKGLDTDTILIYSNRTESIAFRGELDNWQKNFPNIKVIYTITDCQPKDRKCVAGKITKDLMIQAMQSWQERVIYLFGPPNMTGAMDNLCSQAGCRQAMIKKETFIGY